MNGQKNLQDLSVDELKIAAFDIDNEIKKFNSNYQLVINVLNSKIKEQDDNIKSQGKKDIEIIDKI